MLLFFFNSFLLPAYLSLPLLLTPIWLFLIFRYEKQQVITMLFIPAIYTCIHLYYGIDLFKYLIAEIPLLCMLLFTAACYYFLKNTSYDLDLIFRNIIILNFLLVTGSLLFLLTPVIRDMFWYKATFSNELRSYPRLKLFTTSPSLYAAWMAPITIYFYSRILFYKTTNAWLSLFMVSVPILFTLSLGVMAALIVSAIAIVRIYFSQILFTPRRKQLFFIYTGMSLLLLSACVYFFPSNPLFVRIYDVFKGYDLSGKVKTFGALMNAHQLIANKSLLWGAGPGQFSVADIPNAAAQTIAAFGYAGLVIRILVEVLLFVKTKVYTNPYRLWLFLFVFLYQFTGSSLTNAAEYIMWALAFAPIFPDITNRVANTEIAQ